MPDGSRRCLVDRGHRRIEPVDDRAEWVRPLMHARRLWLIAALVAVSLSGCGDDDSPEDESPAPAGTGALDTPEGVTDSAAATLVDPDVPASNVSNQAEAPLDPQSENS